MWVSIYSINQSQVQRYISCKTLGHAKMWAHPRPLLLTLVLSGPKPLNGIFCLSGFRSLYVNMVGLWVTVSLAVFSGLTMFSIYKNCDPLTNGDVKSSDQVNANGCFLTAAVSGPDEASFVGSVCLCAPAAALPRDGYAGGLPWNPWLVCGCCLQRHPEVRPGTGAPMRRKKVLFF